MRISDWSSDVCSSDLLCEAGRSLAPSEHLLDALAAALADRIAGVTGGAPIHGSRARLAILREMPVDRDVGGDRPLAQIFHELPHVIGLVGTPCDPTPPSAPVQQIGRETCRDRVWRYV